MTIDEIFTEMNQKNNIKRESIRGRLSELKTSNEIEKVGKKFSILPS